jgi:transposase
LCIHKRFCDLTRIVSEISQPSTTSTPVPSPSPADAAIIANLQQQLGTAQQQLDSTQQGLQVAELKVQMREEKLRRQRIAKYGPSSEKLATLEMELLEEEPGVSEEEVQAKSQRERLPSTRNRRKHPGRQSLPATLPRVERVIACTPAQCVCSQCGAETAVIAYEESAHLDVEPAKYFVVVTKREKRACKSCEEQGVMAAPLPPRIIEKSLVSDRVVIDTLINRYSSHLPKSCFGKACRYALHLWDKLTRFLDHPELELSTNRAENSMRPVALGRRNWIHLGDEQAGPKVAAILSVIESCRRLHIPARDYLAAILPGLNDLPI